MSIMPVLTELVWTAFCKETSTYLNSQPFYWLLKHFITAAISLGIFSVSHYLYWGAYFLFPNPRSCLSRASPPQKKTFAKTIHTDADSKHWLQVSQSFSNRGNVSSVRAVWTTHSVSWVEVRRKTNKITSRGSTYIHVNVTLCTF
jgi:hypothetical protein